MVEPILVYLEVGTKKTFAIARDWPGWARSGRDEAAALQALRDYGTRYARALRPARLGFKPPTDGSEFEVVERLKGNATTDFGAPDMPAADDADPVDNADLQRYRAILRAAWKAFDVAVIAARGKVLRKGPRGGGRELDQIIQHLLESDASYLAMLGVRFRFEARSDPDTDRPRIRQAVLEALEAAAAGQVPKQGPRGGVRWTLRRFVRRVAWHVLDHAWEIEDRVIGVAVGSG